MQQPYLRRKNMADTCFRAVGFVLFIFLVFCVVFFVVIVFVLCHVYPMLPVSLDCPFLIAPSVFSNLYLEENQETNLIDHGISRKKLVRVYNAHGLLKKIVVGNVRIKYQSYIFFSPLSMFHLLGEFQNHLSLFIFNKVAKY